MSNTTSFLIRMLAGAAASVVLAAAANANGHGGFHAGGFHGGGGGYRGGGGHVAVAGGVRGGFSGSAHSLAPGHFGSPHYSRGFARAGVAGYTRGGWGGGYWRGGYWPRAYYGRGISWFLPVLPLGYATLWWGGMPYYYWDDAYYIWSPRDRGYIVTDPPPVAGSASTEDAGTASASSAELYVYPRNGQSEQQTATDRFECHQWASGQSGFDPSRSDNPSGASAEGYQRAMSACLDARGYSAR